MLLSAMPACALWDWMCCASLRLMESGMQKAYARRCRIGAAFAQKAWRVLNGYKQAPWCRALWCFSGLIGKPRPSKLGSRCTLKKRSLSAHTSAMLQPHRPA
jgi:hypothetical protein